MNRTYSAKPNEVDRKWYIVDAAGLPVGRVAAQVAKILRGKHKPTFTYNQDVGDFVIVINAAKAIMTGQKHKELIYWHSGWPGGLKNISRGKMLEDTPEKLMEKVIWGMIPKTKLGKATFSKLKVYADDQHKHEAQKPELLSIAK